MQSKTKKVVFRCEPALEKFLKGFAKAHGQTPSEMIRNILTYFYTGYLMGEFTTSQKDFEKTFKKRFKTKASRRKFIEKYNPEKFEGLLRNK